MSSSLSWFTIDALKREMRELEYKLKNKENKSKVYLTSRLAQIKKLLSQKS